MGGLGPGIGGGEIFVIGLVALLVVGPQRLPLLMRKVGQALGKARAMANEFRASFDEMARQSELDELRKEVDALRRNQMLPLGAEAETTFREINAEMNRPLTGPEPAAPASLTGPEEVAAMAAPTPAAPVTEAKVPAKPKTRKAAAAKSKPEAGTTGKTAQKPRSARAEPKVTRTKAVDL